MINIMEHRTNRRYRKLRVKKSSSRNSNNLALLDHVSNKDEENFKINRFMKDVKRFYKFDETNKSCGDGLDLCQDKLKGKTRKEGLFLRGVIPKAFNKGLMPPTLSARLNEDLEKMIQWANGRKKKCDKFSDKKVIDSGVQRSQKELSNIEDVNNTRQKSSPVNDLNSLSESNNECYSNKNDLFIQFTHYVTRCLFNSGIDKTELKSHSDSIKESLVEIYQNNKGDISFNNSSQHNSNMYSTPDDQHKTPSNSSFKESFNRCPQTSKSEDGPRREIFVKSSDSQLSDDVIIRKSNQLMFASGLDYLKAVYNGNVMSTKDLLETGSNFSPISQHNIVNKPKKMSSKQDREYLDSVNRNDSNNADQINNDYDFKQYTGTNFEGYVTKNNDFNRFQSLEDVNPSVSTLYLPGIKHDYRYQNNNPYLQNYESRCSFVNSTETSGVPTESPEYSSRLPSNHVQYNTNLQNEYTSSNSTNMTSNDYYRRDRVIEPYLMIPLHPQPVKSPDIQFKPRRMF